ncbi:MAG: molybdenum cofactor biosynthesis protein MoaE [Alphaproteobacteria bacterium]|jgi:molybdopterin synthase catalytic subunit|nr:molybdenum cofactor biosynthesis protein MoaE [Alphaproteobacteria bacterium]
MAARVQREDFDVGAEIAAMSADALGIGAVASFVGLVRGEGEAGPISALTLEHYPGMTERKLAEAEAEARARWPLAAVRIVHRFGRLEPGSRIVLVATAAAHRDAAFAACAFLMDWLKTDAPFWKLEEGPGGAQWVSNRESDAIRRRQASEGETGSAGGPDDTERMDKGQDSNG